MHGGIDGFSRLIVFMDCSNNNRSRTVLQYFLAAVQCYEIPERVRTDRGGENTQASYCVKRNKYLIMGCVHVIDEILIIL